jgi:hypothetical protein
MWCRTTAATPDDNSSTPTEFAPPKILADLFEAYAGAIYLHSHLNNSSTAFYRWSKALLGFLIIDGSCHTPSRLDGRTGRSIWDAHLEVGCRLLEAWICDALISQFPEEIDTRSGAAHRATVCLTSSSKRSDLMYPRL